MVTVRSTIPTSTPESPIAVDLTDRAALHRWAAALREQIDDALAAALDATAPPAQRDLGRRLAREQIREASASIDHLFTAAGLTAASLPRAVFRFRASPPP